MRKGCDLARVRLRRVRWDEPKEAARGGIDPTAPSVPYPTALPTTRKPRLDRRQPGPRAVVLNRKTAWPELAAGPPRSPAGRGLHRAPNLKLNSLRRSASSELQIEAAFPPQAYVRTSNMMGTGMKPIRGLSLELSLGASLGLCLVTLGISTATVAAQPVRWTSFSIPETGTSVEIPSAIFSEQDGRPDGYGQKFKTADGRANLTVQTVPNTEHESPAAFLARKNPPSHIQYKRVTPRFFAVSSIKNDYVWYNRCNFSARFVHCVLINYPAAEEHDWDGIVTHISLSLRGG
jgi:hypothetical protein